MKTERGRYQRKKTGAEIKVQRGSYRSSAWMRIFASHDKNASAKFPGHEERLRNYEARAAAGLPLFAEREVGK